MKEESADDEFLFLDKNMPRQQQNLSLAATTRMELKILSAYYEKPMGYLIDEMVAKKWQEIEDMEVPERLEGRVKSRANAVFKRMF